MKKRILTFLLCIIIVFTITACSNKVISIEDLYNLECLKNAPKDRSDATPLLWKVTASNGGVVYLFGSIHIADSSYLRLSDFIMQAYLDCDALAVELDIIDLDNDYAKSLEMAVMAMYLDGTNLDNHITKELADQYLDFLIDYPEFLNRLGVTIDNIDILRNFKPGFLSGLPSSIAAEKSGLTSDYGIDMLFLKISKEIKKEIIEIETVAFQANLLYNVPDILGKMMIEDALTFSLEDAKEDLNSLYNAWKYGDLDYFESMIDAMNDINEGLFTEGEFTAYKNYILAMYDNRNFVMADAAESYLSIKKSTFIVVGEAHMVGENGIVNILKDRGYTVELLSGNGLTKSIAE